jgi:hypothetical protein
MAGRTCYTITIGGFDTAVENLAAEGAEDYHAEFNWWV